MARNNSRARERKRQLKAQRKAEAKAKNNKYKKNKGNNMAWWNNNTSNKSTATGSKAKGWSYGTTGMTIPTENKDPETLSTVLFSQAKLNEIATMCLPEAGGSEFQVHYRGAQFIVQKPDSNMRMVWTVPTYFFNMPQKVSTASVDFNLDEVAAISDQLAPMSFEMTKKIAEAFPVAFFEAQGFTVSVRELEMGSIHRHPGAFGFSTTDMDNKVNEPGVIFRNRGCDDKVQVDSVMHIPGKICNIHVTETRVVTVKTAEDGGIEGSYSEAPTVSCILNDAEEVFTFAHFFGEEEQESKTVHSFKTANKWIHEDLPQIEEIFDAFLQNMDYDPQLIIDPKLITQSYIYNSYRKPASSYGANANLYDGYDGYESEEDSYYDNFLGKPKTNNTSIGFKPEDVTGTGPAASAPALSTRPTWRKTQALGLLRAKGIAVDTIPDIDGSASDEDIIAISKALKDKNIGDVEIRKFFDSCAYPPTSLYTYYNDVADKIDKVSEIDSEAQEAALIADAKTAV